MKSSSRIMSELAHTKRVAVGITSHVMLSETNITAGH